jgi:hypothetical protein
MIKNNDELSKGDINVAEDKFDNAIECYLNA